MTLPPCRSWFLEGERLEVAYEAPQGRRVNVLGAHFTHGPAAGRLDYQTWAAIPTSRAKQPRTTLEARAAAHGLTVAEVGPIDAARVVAFLWQVAGRPADAPATLPTESTHFVRPTSTATYVTGSARCRVGTMDSLPS
jgi:hypothetical protein